MSNKEQVCDGGAAVAGMVCGIDVSATRLDVAVQQEGLDGFRRRLPTREPGTGASSLAAAVGALGARVALEASGVYSLDVALALDEAGWRLQC